MQPLPNTVRVPTDEINRRRAETRERLAAQKSRQAAELDAAMIAIRASVASRQGRPLTQADWAVTDTWGT